MSDQSKQLAELKQQILEQISEEELETSVGGSITFDPRSLPIEGPLPVNHNTGVRSFGTMNPDVRIIPNMNMGARVGPLR